MTNPSWFLPPVNPDEEPAPGIELQKQGYLVQFTDEQVADVTPFRVFSREEIEESRAKMRAEAAAELVRVRALLSKAHPALQPVILHHSPEDRWLLLGEWSCKGCDAGSYAEDSPAWPCSTIELILEGIEE